MASDEERIQRFQRALEEHQDQGTRAQAEAIERFLIAQPSAAATDSLWKTLVFGLLALIALGLVALAFLVLKDKSTEAVLPIVTALVTGLFGLFIASPS
jgi:hypothetical protein